MKVSQHWVGVALSALLFGSSLAVAQDVKPNAAGATAISLGAGPSEPEVQPPAAPERFDVESVLRLQLERKRPPLEHWQLVLRWLAAEPENPLALDLVESIGGPPPGRDTETLVHVLGRLRTQVSDIRVQTILGQWLAELEWRSASSGMPMDLGEDLFPNWMGQFWTLGPLGALTDPEPLWTPRNPDADPEVQLKSSYTTDWGREVQWRPVRRSARRTTVPGDAQPYQSGGTVYLLSGAQLDAGQGYLDIATEDSVRVLWNGETVFFRKVGGPSSMGDWFRIPVHFQNGVNRLLIVTDGSRFVSVGARLLDSAMQPVVGADVNLDQLLSSPASPDPARRGLWGEVQRDPRPPLADSPAAELLQGMRTLQAGRPDVTLGIARPADEAWVPLWNRLRYRALSQAGYLPAEVQRQRTLEVEREIQAEGEPDWLISTLRIQRLVSEDKPLEAMAELEALQAAGFQQPSLHHLAIQVASAVDEQGWLAQSAIQEACAAWPNDPEFQERLANAYASHGNSVLALEHAILAIRLGSRSQGMIRQAANGLAVRPDDDRRAWLLATLERWAHLGSSDRSWENLLQDALVILGERDLAIERATRLAKRYPDDLSPWMALMDLALEGGARAGDATLELALANIQRLEPATESLLDLRRADEQPVEADSFFKAFAPDPGFAWQAAQGLEKSSTVEILDSGLVYLYPDGSRIGRVAVITKAEDRTGTEELHEIQALGNPLVARVLKADGTTREPVLVQGSWAMPSLDPGDAVELQYEWRTSDDWGAPVDLGIWRFASSERPYALSRYVVFVPKGLTLDVRTQNFLGSHVTESWGGGTVHILTSEKQARIEAEPLMPSEVEIFPVVHFAVDRTTHSLEQTWRSLLHVALDLPLELQQGLDRWVAEIDPTLSAAEKAQGLYLRLHEELVEFDGSANPSEVWFAKRGQPILLFGALLERAKIPFEWGLLRKGMSPELDPNPVALYENLDANASLILRIPSSVDGQESVHWQIPPPRKGLGFGALPDTMGGAEVVILQSQGTRTEILPRSGPDENWKNHLVLNWNVLESGAAEVEGVWSIQTNDGVLMRRQVSQAPAQQRDAFVRQVVASFAPGVNLTSSEILDLNQVGAPIRIRFEGVRPDFLEPQGEGFKADLRLPKAGLSTGLGPSQRNWPLAARFVIKDRFEVNVTVPEGWTVESGPQPFAEERQGFQHRLQIEPQADAVWRLEKTFELRGMVLAPSEVPAFLERAAALEREEARPLVVNRPKSDAPEVTAPAEPVEAPEDSDGD